MAETPETPKTAKKPRSRKSAKPAEPEPVPVKRGWKRRVWRWVKRISVGIVGFYLFLIVLFSFVPLPINLYQMSEVARLGSIDKDWVPMEEIAPIMARAVVAAEDANFCNHWGFDMSAIREAIAEGGNRGASTLSQQVVKNVFLWQDRSYLRKAMEGVLTPVVETLWSKRRILEVYLNVAEFDEGVFGVQAAAKHYFGVDAKDLSSTQAARLAAILPNPKQRSASKPTDFIRKRARSILSGAETIKADGRSACFDR